MKKVASYQNKGTVQLLQRPINGGYASFEYDFGFSSSVLYSYTNKRPWFYKDLC
ncbi:MAG TPA: hypothetical protein PKM63_07745 [Panacibacter sp.]|nr:hypothetical protein [Panacibacter sp.]HNP44163.1 hypothetical protein [Panacibacter sp.]